MATHLLTLKGNYIWLDDLANDKRYEGLAKEVLVRSDLDDSTIFYFDGLNQFDKNTGIDFTDIDVNGNGAFATLAEWQDWYTTNTGNFNGGGSAPKYYVANIYQSGTDAPDLMGSVLRNEKNLNISFVRNDIGDYSVVFDNYSFNNLEGNTRVIPSLAFPQFGAPNVTFEVFVADSGTINIRTYLSGVQTDGLIADYATLKIEIYE